jgi:hypothetical protein
LVNVLDSEYLCPVTIGTTNAKTLQLDFDTGSSDLWVFSSSLPASSKTGHNIYTVDSTKRLSGATWSISYGDGSGAKGTVYKDTVKIGAATVTSQAVEAATSVSSEFGTWQEKKQPVSRYVRSLTKNQCRTRTMAWSV